MKLVNGQMIHGFRVEYSQPLEEIGATLYRMRYEKNGADLIWLDRDDENMTFFIAFKTIPFDDSGVFHILEHSVLCGSRKYPVKEPFVELLKSSLQTFLNAFTYPDKTVYPVCSRNEKDFMNLVDVYMDAVFHPLSITDPHAFRQEGWHYEMEQPEDELRCNGVVYNEMKGAYSSVDTVLQYELEKLMFPDNCYGFESGGHPDAIPTLTYDNYLKSHARYYHPSNSRIFLDGSMNLDAVLAELDSYLSEYDYLNPSSDIPMQGELTIPEHVCAYEIGEDEDPEGKVVYAEGTVFSDFNQVDLNLAGSVLAEVLCGSNEAPLTKAILDAELAEDVELSVCDGTEQNYMLLILRNLKEENVEAARDLVNETVRRLVKDGLDKKRLSSVINHLEYVTREKDFGTMPRGLVYGLTALDSWMYDGDPALNLSHDSVFRRLYSWVESGRFEELLSQIMLSEHKVCLRMIPDAALGAKRRNDEKQRLEALKNGFTAEQIQNIIDDFRVLREKQSEEDSPEKLALLPSLSLSDVTEIPKDISPDRETIDQVPVLRSHVETDGIVYVNLYFSLADIPQEKLPCVSFLTSLLSNVETDHYNVNDLYSELDARLGRFSVSNGVYGPTDLQTKPYLNVYISALENHLEDLVSLTDEILNHSHLNDREYIFNYLRQQRISMEQGVSSSGDSFASMRAGAMHSITEVLNENIKGLSLLRFLQAAEKNFKDHGDELIAECSALLTRLFTRSRLTVCVSGNAPEEFLKNLISVFPERPMGELCEYHTAKVQREGYIIPSDVGYAARYCSKDKFGPADKVGSQFLSLDYLWQVIRVKGGAYGTRLFIRNDEHATFSTYRDPSPNHSLTEFDFAPDAIRKYVQSGESPDKYIISTIASSDPLLTPRLQTMLSAVQVLSGKTYEDRCLRRREVLNTDAAALLAFADDLEEALKDSTICVIAGSDEIAAGTFDVTEAIQNN